jgi:hypothetical protein
MVVYHVTKPRLCAALTLCGLLAFATTAAAADCAWVLWVEAPAGSHQWSIASVPQSRFAAKGECLETRRLHGSLAGLEAGVARVVRGNPCDLMIPDLPGEPLRRKVRAQLAARQLFLADGVSSVRRGTGRPCTVCGCPIDSPTLEREGEGPGVVARAHPACYVIWRKESMARQRKTG